MICFVISAKAGMTMERVRQTFNDANFNIIAVSCSGNPMIPL
jgi:hypothetical protein